MNPQIENCYFFHPQCLTAAGSLVDVGATCSINGGWHYASSTCSTQLQSVGVYATTSDGAGTSTPIVVDNPVFDFIGGIILAYVVMFGVIWFFRRK